MEWLCSNEAQTQWQYTQYNTKPSAFCFGAVLCVYGLESDSTILHTFPVIRMHIQNGNMAQAEKRQTRKTIEN